MQMDSDMNLYSSHCPCLIYLFISKVIMLFREIYFDSSGYSMVFYFCQLSCCIIYIELDDDILWHHWSNSNHSCKDLHTLLIVACSSTLGLLDHFGNKYNQSLLCLWRVEHDNQHVHFFAILIRSFLILFRCIVSSSRMNLCVG